MRNLIPGEWFVVFICNACGSRQILFPDLSKGKGKLGRVTYRVACSDCGHEDSYHDESIERYQHSDSEHCVKKEFYQTRKRGSRRARQRPQGLPRLERDDPFSPLF